MIRPFLSKALQPPEEQAVINALEDLRQLVSMLQLFLLFRRKLISAPCLAPYLAPYHLQTVELLPLWLTDKIFMENFLIFPPLRCTLRCTLEKPTFHPFVEKV